MPNAAPAASALVDSSRCWAVAMSMAVYTFFAMAVLKSSAVLYVGSMEMLGLNREEASWPATLALMLSQLAGPLYGVLLKFLSERTCLVIGAILCSAPVIGAAYVHDVYSLGLLVGIIHGLGSACSEVVPFVVLMRHFRRYRGTVISAMYIITAVSGFIMPGLYEYIRQQLGFRVCLLIMGSVNAGMLLGCIIVNRVPPLDDQNGPASTTTPSAAAADLSSAALPAQSNQSKLLTEMSLSTDSFLVGSILMSKSYQNRAGTLMLPDSVRACRSPLIGRSWVTSQSYQASRSVAAIPSNRSGLLSFSFIHITFSRAATIFALAVYLLVLLDYATDRGFEPVQGLLLLTLFTVGDLLSRILSGSLIDLQIVSPTLLMSATFLVQGGAYFMLIYVDMYLALLAASFLVGLTGGCRNILATVMVTEECEERLLAMSLGLMNFATGVTIVFQPKLIGYVRDALGSYEPLLSGFATMNVILAFTWFVRVICDCRRRRFHNTM